MQALIALAVFVAVVGIVGCLYLRRCSADLKEAESKSPYH